MRSPTVTSFGTGTPLPTWIQFESRRMRGDHEGAEASIGCQRAVEAAVGGRWRVCPCRVKGIRTTGPDLAIARCPAFRKIASRYNEQAGSFMYFDGFAR